MSLLVLTTVFMKKNLCLCPNDICVEVKLQGTDNEVLEEQSAGTSKAGHVLTNRWKTVQVS